MLKKIFSFPKKSISPQKGFTLIGVLVASGLGLIVVTGLSQLFVNMSSQLKQLENKAKQAIFRDVLWNELKDGCENTLKPLASDIAQGNKQDFAEIRDEHDRTSINLSIEKDRLEAEYGLTGNFTFQISCTSPQPDGTSDCDCETAGTYPCAKKWSLSMISQSMVKGVLVYNRNFSFDLNIEYMVQPSTTTPPNEDFRCNVTGLSGSPLPPPPPVDCFHVNKANKIALLGCGTTKDITEQTTTAYGYNAGHSSAGKENTFIGYEAGGLSTGEENTFIGYQAGKRNSTGKDNTFVGNWAGFFTTYGRENTFIGSGAGNVNSGGSNNIFVGYAAGNGTNANDNTFIGHWAGGFTANGARNTFVGGDAGVDNSTGSDNVFIGYRAGDGSSTASNKFAIGNNTDPNWITGDIDTNDLFVNGNQVLISSSRTLKKNIKPFKDFKKALKDLLKTPLFTFEYKKEHPEKSRMGIISEELPEHLQIKQKDQPSLPDWVSIYGSFWAGIKALHEMLTELKQEFFSKMENLEKSLSQKREDFNQEFFSKIKGLNSSLNLLKDRQNNLQKELSQLKSEFSALKKDMEETKDKQRGKKPEEKKPREPEQSL